MFSAWRARHYGGRWAAGWEEVAPEQPWLIKTSRPAALLFSTCLQWKPMEKNDLAAEVMDEEAAEAGGGGSGAGDEKVWGGADSGSDASDEVNEAAEKYGGFGAAPDIMNSSRPAATFEAASSAGFNTAANLCSRESVETRRVRAQL
jgi:hypothetical protein